MSELELRDRALVAVQRALATRMLSLPPSVQLRIAGGVAREVEGSVLDPQAQLLIFLAERLDPLRAPDVPLVEARRSLERSARVLGPTPPPLARSYDTLTDASHGHVPVRVYVPTSLARAKEAPGLLYLHGGGFALGSVDSHDAFCRELSDETSRVVVSVEYRRSPEHKFPAAVDDAVAAFRWMHAEARALGVDPARIAVAGDSAGGNLSAVITHAQRRAKGPLPSAQVLIYPATDLTRSMRSHRLFATGYILDARTIDWFLDRYLRTPADACDVRASPLFEDDFHGLPPALVVTAGFDPLRDEGEAYAAKLKDAGVPMELVREGGMFHGFMSLTGGLAVAKRTRATIAAWLRANG
jgi:acetyl esterase